MVEPPGPRLAGPEHPPPGPQRSVPERIVGRARVDRVTGRARPYPRPRPVRAVVPGPDVSTRVVHRPAPTAPIFLDRSGRRARRLRRAARWCIAAALVLLAVLWLSQALVVAGGTP